LKVLVTGANGFLGRHVVDALHGAGHSVHAMVRPSTSVDALGWGDDIQVVRADLKSERNLARLLEGIDTVVHLAAAMSGSDFARFSETTTTTEHLLEAIADAGVQRLVLCSSFSVYDWPRAHGEVDEGLPLLEGHATYERGGYACAKRWQERIAERAAKADGFELSIIRPGFIWGPGNACPNGSIGPTLGPLHLVFAAGRELPFTHVVNCADCIRTAVEHPNAAGVALNLVDGHEMSAWSFMGEYLRRSGEGGIRIWLPHALLWPSLLAVYSVARAVLGARIKLPSIFMPAGYAQGYRPLHYSTERLRSVLDWQPPLSLAEAFDHTFKSEVGANSR
jgi:nucleoside-diphosphate-sugar epimerase